jgi:DNA modification methylase
LRAGVDVHGAAGAGGIDGGLGKRDNLRMSQAPIPESQLQHIVPQLRALAVPIDALVLDPNNARKHDRRNLDTIRASLERFGQRLPIVVQRTGNVVRAGNGRVTAARELGWKHIAAVVVDDPDQLATAFGIADNWSADLATWDPERLLTSLAGLSIDGTLNGLGDWKSVLSFEEADLDKLIAVSAHTRGAGEVVEDEAPLPPAVPITRHGDLWVLGRHRLLCGDSTKAEDVTRLLDGAAPALMITDPPYGVDYDPEWRTRDGVGKAKAIGKVENDTRVDWREAWDLFSGDVAYVWHSGKFAGEVAETLRAAGFEIRSQIIWAKHKLIISRGHYHWQHEPLWYAVREGKTASWIGDRKQSTLWEILNTRVKEDMLTNHSTQKPIECMARPMRNHEGDVYDPFVGSGTSVIAAEQLGRRCFAMELSPIYCDVVVERWQRFTGQTAVREGAKQ